ncbi:hypothetical protein MKW98_001869 [Papaver atlanticum]|uniref:DNA-directed RNA polymerase III subunit RPC9 n=1 Tax=Papaver atlanticum TaxID=357466 RepID=A0AAD4XQF2_9MAGN|nr:hypothetical protein MKW98_001869 [Papaver atlanticum]
MKVKNANAGSPGLRRYLRIMYVHELDSPIPVHYYLLKTAACDQTLETIDQFLNSCEKYELVKAKNLNIINIRPSTQVEIDLKRLADEAVVELVELIANLFPPTPKPEGADEDEEGIFDGSPMEGTDDVKEGTDGLTLDDTDKDKEGTDGFTRDDPDEGKDGFSDGLLPKDTDEVTEGTTYGLTLANTDDR